MPISILSESCEFDLSVSGAYCKQYTGSPTTMEVSTFKFLRIKFNNVKLRRITYIFGGANVTDLPDFLGNHAQLFKVDEAVYFRIIAFMDECQVFLEDGVERNLGKE